MVDPPARSGHKSIGVDHSSSRGTDFWSHMARRSRRGEVSQGRGTSGVDHARSGGGQPVNRRHFT